MRKILFGTAALILLLFLDQFTKQLAILHLKNSPAVPVISGVFELSYLENHGAAFWNSTGTKDIFNCYDMYHITDPDLLIHSHSGKKHFVPLHVLLILLISGAIGNFIDRCAYDYVVDFFYFKLIDFPVFNVADIYVTAAAVLLFLLFFFYYKEEDLDVLAKYVRLKEKKEQH